ncbi:MAG TPA: hypothetical protein VFG55_00150 [Rhodanobacteraceae bacterium]|nr:hypothetical protein [Rhodanobacteraceae bacterium]
MVAPALPAGWDTTFDGASAAWTTSGALVDSPPNAAGIAGSPTAVGNSYLDSPPGEQGEVFHFRHAYALESTFDGGVLEISIEGGAFEDILAAGGQFVGGGYNGTISAGFGSPIGGRQAWTGSSGGYITTEVNLPPAAIGVSSVLRWRLASDSSVGGGSWYVDSIGCGAPPPPPPAPWVYGADYPIPILDEATTVLNGVLYSFGGVSNGALTDTAYAYDGSSWTAIAPLPLALEVPVAVNDGSHIFILGGADDDGLPTTSLYEYVVATNSYTTLAPFTVPAWAHSAVVVDGKIVKFAGHSTNAPTGATEIYDIASNTWSTARNYPQALSFVGAFEYGGYVYGVGGIGTGEVSSLKTYRYEPSIDRWQDAPIRDLPDTRWGASSAGFDAGAMVAGGYVGGADNGTISASAMFWDGTANQWRELPAMPGDGARLSGAMLNGRFTVVGGRSNATPGSTGTTQVQVFDGTGFLPDTFTSTDVVAITDDAYDGTLGSMVCTDIDTSAIPARDAVTSVTVKTNITHSHVGDLVAKLVSVDGSVLTLFNRPGFAEPADDGSGGFGTPANLASTSPLTFADGSANDAESMGAILDDSGTICQALGICDYFPNPGAATVPPATFADLAGETASGIWSLCVGDAGAGNPGTLQGWSITIDHLGVDPVIGVTPATLSATQLADTTTDQILSIANTGTVDLNWSIDEATACATPSDLPWVSVNPSVGTTAPGASSDVTVTFDSTGLAVGNYAGLLCVASDDPVTPLVEVPVDLTVTATVVGFCDGGDDTIFCGGFE